MHTFELLLAMSSS